MTKKSFKFWNVYSKWLWRCCFGGNGWNWCRPGCSRCDCWLDGDKGHSFWFRLDPKCIEFLYKSGPVSHQRTKNNFHNFWILSDAISHLKTIWPAKVFGRIHSTFTDFLSLFSLWVTAFCHCWFIRQSIGGKTLISTFCLHTDVPIASSATIAVAGANAYTCFTNCVEKNFVLPGRHRCSRLVCRHWAPERCRSVWPWLNCHPCRMPWQGNLIWIDAQDIRIDAFHSCYITVFLNRQVIYLWT